MIASNPAEPEVDSTRLARDRRERLREALSSSRHQALILTTAESVHYVAGYRSMAAGGSPSQMVALLTEDDCWLVAPAGDSAAAVDSGFPVDRIVSFGRFFFESINPSPLTDVSSRNASLSEAVVALVRQLSNINNYGVEVLEDYRYLESVATAEDATRLVRAVRANKLPAEVTLLRYAAQLGESSIASCVKDARSGEVTEKELARKIAMTMVRGGAEPKFVVATTGERSALSDAPPTDRVWVQGELARFDVGCLYEGYWSDIGRTCVLGEPSGLQSQRYEAVLAAEEEQFKRVGPGVQSNELFDVAVNQVRDHGLIYRRHHCGHGIGMAVYETPLIAPHEEKRLEPNMVLNLETPYYQLGWGGMMVEDTIRVTEDGMERLTLSDRGLWVIGA